MNSNKLRGEIVRQGYSILEFEIISLGRKR